MVAPIVAAPVVPDVCETSNTTTNARAYPAIFTIRLNKVTGRYFVLQTQRRPGETAFSYSRDDYATSTHAQIELDSGKVHFGPWSIFQE